MPPLRILFLAAEVAPFAKMGGLADVAGSLPKALAALGHEVRVVMPAYAAIEDAVARGNPDYTTLDLVLDVPMRPRPIRAGVFQAMLPRSEVPVFFVAEHHQFARSKLYGYGDDPSRFAFYGRAALDLIVAAQQWRPDVVHAHDWHAAPAVLWLATAGMHDDRYRAIPTLFTVHNLAYQGYGPWAVLNELGVETLKLVEEAPGEVNFMARGIYHATMINTVSPTYAREILTRDGGAGLDGLLRHRQYDVHGVLNGVDYDEWNPLADRHLAQPFDAASVEARVQNKRALQARARLPLRDDLPMVAMVARLDRQKGLDICGHVIHLLMNGLAGEVQFVVLGSGRRDYEEMFAHLAGYHREKMSAFLYYAADLAPLIYGGSDILLMPSLYEPCGLGQLIAMHYGSVPVVRATGGLVDTVQDGVTGFAFRDFSVEACAAALQRAIWVYRTDPEGWRRLQQNGMAADFSWTSSARGYQQIYEWAIARTRGY
jgi:starch synthase